jgi:membrane fusion protein (multidrug efflux system)
MLAIASSLLISQTIIISGCSSETPTNETVVDSFQVITPILVDTSYQEQYVAEIQSLQNVEIRAKVRGYIEQIHVDEGKMVREGDILFTLIGRAFQENIIKANAAIKSIQAELKVVEVEIKNTKLLLEKNIVSNTEMEMLMAKKEAILAKMEEEKSSLALAELNLSYTRIRAPFTGVINRIPNKKGSLVEEGTLLTSLSDNREVFAYFNLSESDYLNYISNKEKGPQVVDLMLANNQLYTFKGKIEATESEFDQTSGNIAFRARFPNPQQLLKHGSNGKILVTKPLKNALLIPLKSTFEIQDKVYVFTIEENQQVKQQQIIPKLRIPHFYVVDKGIDVNSKVLFEGAENLKNGDKIYPITLPKNELMRLVDQF